MSRSRILLSKYTQKTLQIAFFSDKNIFMVKQFYELHNDGVHAPKKMRKVQVLDETLFCKISELLKKITVSVATSKTGKTSNFFVEPNAKVNARYYRNELLKKMNIETNRLAKHNDYLFV